MTAEPDAAPPARRAIVIGASSGIGRSLALRLAREGYAVGLAARRLSLLLELQAEIGSGALVRQMDVSDTALAMVQLEELIEELGGADLIVVNAGIGLVSSLAEMDLRAFRRLESVNLEGTLTVLSAAARHFAHQGSGGDVVLVSTKNVFAPGARFGAYSATKAAAHQLARIASLELAELDVRVNMVAPDAVFAHGGRKSGLWAEVGPDRMNARGLDEKGLEEYYRSRNLLKAKITAEHVANAVLFFATRQTPTTGATIPVDGGLPDATPR